MSSQRTPPVAPPHPISETYLSPKWASGVFRIPAIIFSFWVLVFVRLPFWIVKRAFVRPRNWGWGRAVWIELVRGFFQVQCDVGLQPGRLTREQPYKGKGVRSSFVWIPPADHTFRVGNAAHTNLKGQAPDFEEVPAFWFAPTSKKRAEGQGEKYTPVLNDGSPGVLLYFHGGAYVTLTAREQQDGEPLGRELVAATLLDMLSVEYRLAGNYSFPAQLQDAISAYVYLTNDLKVPAEKIILVGDSAGANLVLALLRYIKESHHHHKLVKPGAAILLSPWLDMVGVLSIEESAKQLDLVPTDFGQWGAKAMSYGHSKDILKTPLLSPFYDDVKSIAALLPEKTFINAGGSEVLRPEIEVYVKKALEGRATSGGKYKSPAKNELYLQERIDGITTEQNGITYDLTEGCPHDFATLPITFQPEINRFMKRVDSWLNPSTTFTISERDLLEIRSCWWWPRFDRLSTTPHIATTSVHEVTGPGEPLINPRHVLVGLPQAYGYHCK
ncbi:putative acetyl-hydrolase [Planoprotostelium fungivorum]|uniref:Putative acetyl-hydrolase n=1 Tax=Planoprotostelium fungivorum TaxID=1890364 RepID=A0A2P6NY46_9EUKA|nr:putative acetyl-hydrolase [Planoprotostelium fungivorum]